MANNTQREDVTVRSLIRDAVVERRQIFIMVAAASLLANVLALFFSLYSMQVYDRVIPSQGISTLIALTVGVMIATALELLVKMAKSAMLELAIKSMDIDLSLAIFQRLLNLRLDQFPATVGTLSAQVRSYESIRAFAFSAALYLLVDTPFALLFLVVMLMIAGPMVALIPAVFFVLAAGVGLMFKKRIMSHANHGNAAANRRLGLLVETVENAENIKSAHAGPGQMARWNDVCVETVNDEAAIRHASEQAAYWAAFIQQTSYVLLVCAGAYIASTTTDLTMGGLIACSILSGRVLGPVAALPNLIVQWAYARAALDTLENVFALQCDNHNVANPLKPQQLLGEYRIQQVVFAYPGNRPPVLSINQLNVAAGTKLALLGAVGSGKSTLLKMLAGLYAPKSGHVFIDNLDILQIDRKCLAGVIGYLPQDTKLLSGTLRDNLTAGLAEKNGAAIDDNAVLEACKETGLIELVSSHPQGLDLPIFEGSKGVSGGQRQLVALTRLLLSRPAIWLLDEPTAAMDEHTERRALSALQRAIAPTHTVVIASHKPILHEIIGRIAVLAPGTGLVIEGPKEAVIARLRNEMNSAEDQQPVQNAQVQA